MKDSENLHPSPAQAQATAGNASILPRIMVVGALILVPLFGLSVTLISFLCVANTCIRSSGGTLISTAPLGKVLTISQVASHVAPLTVPIVMGLFAYWLGAQWLVASTEGGKNRPSPSQSVFSSILAIS
jgi:hypothetical protein